MRLKIFFFICLFSLSKDSNAQGMWTWMAGTDTQSSAYPYAIYGIKGVPSINNRPPDSYSAYCWTDLEGNFWMYGGNSGCSDMWKFNPISLEWTWVKGNGQIFNDPVFGTKGIENKNNSPGQRTYSGATWVDLDGDLWLYGGATHTGYLGDLWRYNILRNKWTWMSGLQFQSWPHYGTKGLPSTDNYPGTRLEISSTWVDANGKLWMYGGQDSTICFSDLWNYNPETNEWTWVNGFQSFNISPVYGTKGIFNSNNTPGSRAPYCVWSDNNNLWLFGGEVKDNFWPFTYSPSDLWEYKISLNQWAWISGSEIKEPITISGPVCHSDKSYYPGTRLENRATWKDKFGNFWMYGGFITDQAFLQFGDLWVYLVGCNEWARVSDSNYVNTISSFGTKGIPSPDVNPGAMGGAAHWTDKDGNFWIFGGKGMGDMWKYTPDLNCIVSSCKIPVANFNSEQTKICVGSCLDFENKTINGNKYEWFFEGGNPDFSDKKNPPPICYDSDGNFAVTLIVYNGNYSDTIMMSNYVSVTSLLNIELTQSNDTVICNYDEPAQYKWILNGDTIFGATNNYFIAHQNGIYTVQIIDEYGCIGFNKIRFNGCGSSFSIFPNPCDQSINVKLDLCQSENVIRIYNLVGQLIYENMIDDIRSISTQNLPAALYCMTLGNGKNVDAKKFIITH